MAVALETIVKQLEDSGIVAQGKLENFIPPKAHPKSVEELVSELVKQNHLTKFQAQQVSLGKSKALILGNYTILDKIGAGGMGQVFKAEHRRMKRVVAIKMLPPAMTKDAAATARFQREVEAAAKLSHPNIVAAHDADEANGAHFLVMEYVEGKDLSATVKKNGPFPVAKAVNYILQAARGLEFAHSEGVIHRDIKPANLLLDKKGVVKILDMGLARIDGGSNAPAQAELTGTGAVMGTVDYMAPEQAMSTRDADARADIYSLGCSLHYLIAGKATYGGESVIEKLLAHREKPIPNLREVSADVSEELEAVFEKMVAKTIEDRYQTMTEVVADLEKCSSGQATSLSIQQSTGTNLANSALTSMPNIQAAPTIQKTKVAKQAAAAELSAGKQPPWKNTKVLIGAGAAGLLCLLLGVWIIIRDKDGNEVAKVKVPEGGTATVQTTPAQPKSVPAPKGSVSATPMVPPRGTKTILTPKATIAPSPTPAPTEVTTPVPRWPLAPSKREDIQWLLGLNSEVTLRTASPLGNASVDKTINSPDEIPSGPATIVGLLLQGNPQPTDDAQLARIAGLVDLESLAFGGKDSVHNFTNTGWMKLASLANLQRLTPARRTAAVPEIMKSLPRLEYVELMYDAADEWARVAATVPSLTEINAYRKPLTDAGLAHLAKMPQLKRINLESSTATPAAFDRFVAAMPGCSIRLGKGQIIEPRTSPAVQPAGPQPPLATTPAGFALDFSPEKKSHVVVPGWKYDGKTPLTAECWVVQRQATESVTSVLSCTQSGGWSIRCDASGLRFMLHGKQKDYVTVRSDAPLQLKRPTHIAGVFNGRECSLYIDGRRQKERKSIDPPYAASDVPLLVGAEPGKTRSEDKDFFDGTIDEVRISTVVRYSADFTPQTRFEPDKDTLMLYHFDEGTGTIAKDSSTNKRNGRVSGATWVTSKIDWDGATSAAPVGEGTKVNSPVKQP